MDPKQRGVDQVFTLPPAEPAALRKIAEANGQVETADSLVELAEGNFGGMTVVTRLAKGGRTDVLDKIYERGMRGEQIWVGFKYACEQDLDAFAAAVLKWDVAMVGEVNRRCDNKLTL